MLIGTGETDVLGRTEDGGVDPDDLAVGVEQRPAGVAEVDRGVGLDVVLEAPRGRVGGQARAVLGGDDAHRDGLVEVERIADGHDPLADADAIRVAQRQRRQALLDIDLQKGEIRRRILPDEPGGVLFLVVDPDLDLVGALDDVVIRHDVAVFRDDEAGASLDFLVLLVIGTLAAAVGTATARGAEKELERIAFAEGVLVAAAAVALDDVGRGDRNDRGHGLLGRIGERREEDSAGAGPGGRGGFPLRLGAGGDVDRAGDHHPENDGGSDQCRKGQGAFGGSLHKKTFTPQRVPNRDIHGTRPAGGCIPRFGRDSEPLVLDQNAAVHGHADSPFLEPPGRIGVDDPELEEHERHAPGDRFVGDRGHVLGTAEHVHDVDSDVRRDRRDRGVAGLSEDLAVVGIHGNDAVALPLQVPGDRVRGPGGIRGTADDRDRLGLLERAADLLGLVHWPGSASSCRPSISSGVGK